MPAPSSCGRLALPYIIPVFFVLGLLLVMGTVSEGAGPEPVDSRQLRGVFAPDPEGVWRTITPSDSTSECIGDPVAPLCAVESHLACYRRHAPTFAASPTDRIGKGNSASTLHTNTFISYRATKTWLAGPKDVQPLPRYAFNRELGDLMIDVILRTCWSEDGYCTTPIIPITFTARKFGERWAVVEIYQLWHSTNSLPVVRRVGSGRCAAGPLVVQGRARSPANFRKLLP